MGRCKILCIHFNYINNVPHSIKCIFKLILAYKNKILVELYTTFFVIQTHHKFPDLTWHFWSNDVMIRWERRDFWNPYDKTLLIRAAQQVSRSVSGCCQTWNEINKKKTDIQMPQNNYQQRSLVSQISKTPLLRTRWVNECFKRCLPDGSTDRWLRWRSIGWQTKSHQFVTELMHLSSNRYQKT